MYNNLIIKGARGINLKRHFCIISVLVLLCWLFYGCSAYDFQFDPEKLMFPPMSSDDQVQIHEALSRSVGGDKQILLKYPKRGEYRSAVILRDIDGDGAEEALAFYTYNENGHPIKVRMSILDKEDGKWNVKYTEAGVDWDVDFVSFDYITSKSGNIIVGYGNSDDMGIVLNKTFKVYEYKDNILSLVGLDAVQEYRQAIFVDKPGTNQKDIMTLSCSNGSVKDEVLIRLFRYENGSFRQVNPFKGNKSSYDDSYNEATSIKIFSDDPDGIKYNIEIKDQNTVLVYLDYDLPRSYLLSTHIVAVTNNMFYEVTNTNFKLYRKKGIYVQDVDNDDVLEIPTEFEDGGVRILNDRFGQSSYIKYIKWMVVDGTRYTEKYNMIYNDLDSYGFIIPDEWMGRVQVKITSDERELIVYTLEDDDSHVPEEILSIISVSRQNSTTSYDPEGYKYLYQNDDYKFYVKTDTDKEFEYYDGVILSSLTAEEVLERIIKNVDIDMSRLNK